nr:DNA polymerase III subunit gamma and tau [Longispora albida]
MTALYRKYRPRTFDEVIGQDHVTVPLIQALSNGRINHAYLFSGPRGCGKTSSARILARSLNCEKGPTPHPCGECRSCRDLAPDGAGSIDVIEIDAASHGGVDDARELREKAFFAPVSSRYKVYVIDEAHMVSSAGFNALLKLVEEPPDYVRFVFATTEPEKVLGTIRSRTHHYPFRLIPPGILRPYCEQLAAAEGVKVEPAVFPLVVKAGTGSARDTLSILDQLIAGAGEEGVTYQRAVALLGVTDAALIDEACDALADVDGAKLFATIDKVAEAGHEPRRFATDLLERLRDLIVLHQVPDAITKGLLDVPADEVERMTQQALRLGPGELSRLADLVHDGLATMRGATAPRLTLELICARMLLPAADQSSAALLQRVERLERGQTKIQTSDFVPATPPQPPVAPPPAAPVQPAPTPATPPPAQTPAPVQPAPAPAPPVQAPAPVQPTPAPVQQPPAPAPVQAPAPAAPAASGARDVSTVQHAWDQVLTQVRNRSPRAAALVRDVTVRALDGDTLDLLCQNKFHADAVTKAAEIVQEAVYQVLGWKLTIRCDIGGAGTRPAASAPAAAPRPQPAPARPAPAQAPAPRSAPVAAAPPVHDDEPWPDMPPPVDEDEPPPPAPMQAQAPQPPAAEAPAASTVTYEGFEPGDEPGDEIVDNAVAHQTVEEQAMKLLSEHLGAEKLS